MTGSLTVAFAGCTERSGPLTRGQDNVLRAVLSQDEQIAVEMLVDLPPGTSVDALRGALRELLVRHESLRTRYDTRPGEWRQLVAGAGELRLGVTPCLPGEARAAAEKLRYQLWPPLFDPSRDLPLRAAVVTDGTACRHLVATVSHLATDRIGLGMLVRELLTLLTGDPLPAPGLQPLDVAELESRPDISRRIRRSRKYWGERVRRAPHAVFPLDDARRESPPTNGILLRSSTVADALGPVALRTLSSRSSVVLSALAFLLTRYAGLPAISVIAPTSNRALPQLRDYTGTQSTDTFLHIDTDGATSFDGIVRRVSKAALLAFHNGWYEAADMWAEIDSAGHSRGIDAFARDCVFNDVSAEPHAPELRVRLADTAESFAHGHIVDLRPEWHPTRLTLFVYRLEDEFTAVLRGDPRVFDQVALRSLGRDLLTVLATAGPGDADLVKLTAAAELAPVVRGRDWVRVDHSWVSMTAVRRLLGDVLEGREFVIGMGRSTGEGAVPEGAPVIECHAVDPSGALSPETIHRACLRLLPGRTAAMAPHRYVLHPAPPTDPTDPTDPTGPTEQEAWQALPVTRAGSGR